MTDATEIDCTVNTTREPTGEHSRYVLIYPDAPGLTNITGLIDHHTDEDLLAVVVIARDGSCEPIALEQEDDGTWVVAQSSAAGDVIEEIQYSEDGQQILHHLVYVAGYSTDEVPGFMVGVNA